MFYCGVPKMSLGFYFLYFNSKKSKILQKNKRIDCELGAGEGGGEGGGVVEGWGGSVHNTPVIMQYTIRIG